MNLFVIEPRRLVRHGLVCLLENRSYRVVAAAPSARGFIAPALASRPRLALLSGHTAAGAEAEARAVRRLWPGIKSILLLESGYFMDLDRLPTLVGTLERLFH